ncbi:hypothetical protein QN277_020588 [Acacia crassicarpa]|uniref:Pentatricopeptide repeat-containing protein n=1 Tax=Acacia crassicarpa TaxID=499986 RepID=A0AAE1MPJ3_9FABA|nr:hypothetical protein QN277_020588 [Acacia crassicarpa]
MIRKRSGINRQRRPSIWQKCTDFRALRQIHASLIVNGFNSNFRHLRELIFTSAMELMGTIEYAHQVFAHIAEPDIFMWNTMIRASAQSSNPVKAIALYAQMDNRSIKPDNFTFPFVLKACTKLFWAKTGTAVHGRVVKFGFQSNPSVRNTLIFFHANCGDLKIANALFEDHAKTDVVPWSALTAAYAKRGDLNVARQLFDEMPVRDLVSWNVMITGYAKQGEMESARKLFDEVPKRDVVTWNAMIAGYVLCSSHEQALELFEEMRKIGERPDEVTMLSLLSACAELGDLEMGKNIHRYISEMCSGDLSTILGNALIDMYSKCGSIEKALEVFRAIRDKDVTSWNSIIGGLAFNGYAEGTLDMYRKMQRTTIRPNEITFVGVLAACSHAGKVDEGYRYFDHMRSECKIEPDMKHYGCMVDMLGRAGLLKEAFDFIHSMKIEPNAVVWRTLLGACRVHGNVELAKLANEKLLGIRKDESGDYILLSNVYASRGEWVGAEKVRKLMVESGVKKNRGYSLVEAYGNALMHYLFDSKPYRDQET